MLSISWYFPNTYPKQILTILQTNKQAIAFQHLWTLSENQTGDGENVDPALLRALLNVNLEAELQREIRDIIDELDIILHIVQQQQDMITRFVKFAEQIMELDISSLKEQQSSTPENVDNADSTTLEALMQQKSTFKIRADDILLEVEDRIKELKGLKSSAESTAQNVSSVPLPSLCIYQYTLTMDRIGERPVRPQAAAG